MPKISVLMPVYKTPEPFLREAVESILNQTAENFEFLILDDCPEDRAAEAVIASYDDARIKYFRNERNLGIAGSRNRLMEMATGDYLAVADHDDVSLPQRLEKEAAYLDAHRECGVVSGWYQLLCRKRGRIRRRPEHNAEIGAALAEGCAVIHPACMLRRQELERLGVRYEEAYTPAEDYALWCRLLSKTRFANLPEVLFAYRNHEGNTSHLQREKMRDASIRIQNFVRRDNPELWAAAEAKMQETVKIRLFGLLPLLTIKRSRNRELWLLFGFVRLFDVGRKRVRKSPG